MALKTSSPTAKELADLCLHHLAENPEQLFEFMNHSGLDPNGLRSAAGTQALAGGLIDYFVRNEALLLALCSAHRLKPETVMRVWAKLNPAG